MLAKGSKDGAPETKGLVTEQVLSSDDFKRLRKLKLQKSIEMQLGRKRKSEEMSSDSESEGSSDDEPSDGERGLSGRLPGAVSAEELKGKPKKNRTKAARLEKAKSGRTDYKKKVQEQRLNRRGGKTNSEQQRSKPLMMAKHSRQVRTKKGMNAKQKVTHLKKHISTLKKSVNHQKFRR